MTNANGAVPARANAIAQSPLYRIGGPLGLYVEQLTGGYAVARPRTPAYPVISSIFQQAFRAIRNEADVAGTLRRAARSIDQDMQDNHDYPFEIKHDDGRRP